MGHLEVEQRRAQREEEHLPGDAEEVAVAEDQRHAAPGGPAPARRPPCRSPGRPCVRGPGLRRAAPARPADDPGHRLGGGLEEHRRDQHQVGHADEPHDELDADRAGDGARAPARGHESEEPLPLVGGEEVHEQGPEDRHHEEAVDADPDEEGPGQRRRRHPGAEERPEDEQRDQEEAVDEGHGPGARQAGHEAGVERDGHEHQAEGRGEVPGQVVDAAADAHLLAEGAEHVVAGQQREEGGEGPERRSRLAGACVDGASPFKNGPSPPTAG